MEIQACARNHTQRPTLMDPDPPLAYAQVGALCSPCFRRLSWRIAEAVDVLAHVRAVVAPGLRAAASDGDRVSGTREATLPFNVGASQLADQLYAALCNWATSSAATMRVRPPAVLERAAEQDLDVQSCPAGISPAQLSALVAPIAQWLEDWLESIAYLPFVADMHDELNELVGKGKAMTLLVPRRKVRQRSRPCTLCGETSVSVSWDGEHPLVACSSCAATFPVEWELVA